MSTLKARRSIRQKREIGTWRCSACGDAQNLYGCAVAIVFGRVEGPELLSEDDTEQTELCAGSIECRVHQGTAEVERWDGGRWVTWQGCEGCDGTGRTHASWDVRETATCQDCRGHGGRWPGIGSARGVAPVTWGIAERS